MESEDLTKKEKIAYKIIYAIDRYISYCLAIVFIYAIVRLIISLFS